MKITFDVATTDGERQKVTTAFADIIALEEHFDIDVSTLNVRQRGGWMAFLAWHALHRTGQTTETYDVWKRKVDELIPDEESGKA